MLGPKVYITCSTLLNVRLLRFYEVVHSDGDVRWLVCAHCLSDIIPVGVKTAHLLAGVTTLVNTVPRGIAPLTSSFIQSWWETKQLEPYKTKLDVGRPQGYDTLPVIVDLHGWYPQTLS